MRRTAVLLLAACLLVSAPARAVTVSVTITDDVFGPTSVTVPLGSSVHWANEGAHTHTSTSDRGFWDSGDLLSGAVFDRIFTSSGVFAYHCMHHSDMHGKVVVPLKAIGSAGAGWTLRWSTGMAVAGTAFDVQYRREGTATWRAFRTNTSVATGFFNPTRAARYFLRARTTNTTTGGESGWSPLLLKRIT